MKNIKLFFGGLLLTAFAATVVLPVSTVGAAALDGICGSAQVSEESAVCANKGNDTNSFVGPLVNTLLFIVGALSVLALIIGGIMYVTSQGASAGVSKAKSTITYAVVGLLVSVIAYALVNWVFKAF